MRRAIVLGVLLTFGVLSLAAAAYQAQQPSKIKIPEIRKVGFSPLGTRIWTGDPRWRLCFLA